MCRWMQPATTQRLSCDNFITFVDTIDRVLCRTYELNLFYTLHRCHGHSCPCLPSQGTRAGSSQKALSAAMFAKNRSRPCHAPCIELASFDDNFIACHLSRISNSHPSCRSRLPVAISEGRLVAAATPATHLVMLGA